MPDTIPLSSSNSEEGDVAMIQPAGRSLAPVLVGGIITTILTLAIVYFITKHSESFYIMGFYMMYIVPVGAILVGLLCGSGYGLVSWLMGIRINYKLLAIICVLQFAAYWAAEYIEYRDFATQYEEYRAEAAEEGYLDEVPPTPSFIGYWSIKAESFTFKSKKGKGTEHPEGKTGYLYFALAIIGFVGGALISPIMLRSVPFCENCERYMKTQTLGLIPGSIKERKIKKNDLEAATAQEDEIAAAGDKFDATLNNLTALAAADDAEGFVAEAQAAIGNKKATNKLPIRSMLNVCYCPDCLNGWVQHKLLAGHGKHMKTTPLPIERVGSDFMSRAREVATRPVAASAHV